VTATSALNRSIFALAALSGVTSFAADVSYFRDVRPIIQRTCQGCHQPNVKSSGLDLTSYEGLMTGGKRGPATSTIVNYLTGEIKPQMPLGQPPLPPDQIELVRAWVKAGAKDDTPPEARDDVSLDKPIEYLQAPVLNALAFSPDGKTLAVSGYREILLHSLDGSTPLRRFTGVSERILSLVFSKDGATLLAAGGTPARFGEIQLWDVAAGKLKHSITVTGDTVFGASMSPDSSRVAVGCTDNTVRIFDVASGKELFKIGNHENWILGTVFGIDGKRIVSVGRDRAAKLTDATSGAFLENVNLLRGELAAVARHPSKDLVVVGGEERTPYIYMMDRPKNMKIADDTTLVRKLERQAGAIAALAWSPDGTRIAVAGASPEVTVYDADSGNRVAAFKGHTAGIYAVAFSPDSKIVATGGFDGQVRLYTVSDSKLIKAFVPVPLKSTPVTQTQNLKLSRDREGAVAISATAGSPR
jgi:WD40 repeat protein